MTATEILDEEEGKEEETSCCVRRMDDVSLGGPLCPEGAHIFNKNISGC